MAKKKLSVVSPKLTETENDLLWPVRRSLEATDQGKEA
jgi:hypothetical protein